MNLANSLTLFRIVLIPFFMYFLLVNGPMYNIIALGIFILASLTDTADGYFARRLNQVTNMGKLLDPLADKLLITGALLVFVEIDKLPSWMAMVIIGREFAVTGMRLVAVAGKDVVAASMWGKLKTVSQMIAVIAMIVDLSFSMILMWIAMFLTVYSGIDYYWKMKHHFWDNSEMR